MKRKLLLLLVMLCLTVSGAWAQELYLEISGSSATLKWGNPLGRPHYDPDTDSNYRWSDGESKADITTLTVHETCRNFNGNSLACLFYLWEKLETINDIGNLRTDDVTNMSSMFEYCFKLTSLDLSSWNVSNVTDMSYMFDGCSVLTSLDIRGWNTANDINTEDMFYSCPKLEKEVEAKQGESGEYWATFYDVCNYVIDEWAEDAQVFKVALDGTRITMTEITDRIINSGEGVVLKDKWGRLSENLQCGKISL